MTDLREAAQMALDALEDLQVYPACYMHGNIDKILKTQAKEEFDQSEDVIVALRAALAQPEQEPVAWDPKIERLYDKNGFLLHQKIKRTPSSEWEDYYPEPQREWQGLTDEEIGVLTVFDGLHHVEVPLLADFIRAIEAKLKEKNYG